MNDRTENGNRNLLRRVKSCVKDKIYRPMLLQWQRIAGNHYCHMPRKRAQQLFEKDYGRTIDWDNPSTFAEKVRWIQFNTDIALWTQLADKVAARDFVAEKGYSEMLIPLLGVWNDVNDIRFDSLPESFVIKPNNGCGDLFVVKDKHNASLKKIRRSLAKSLRSVYGAYSAETQYRGIAPKILAEEMLHETQAPGGVTDYKFFCCGGQPVMCMVCTDRNFNGEGTKRVTMYDMDWVRRDEWLLPSKVADAIDVARPASFEQMKQACRTLTMGIPFVRLDLYEDNGEVRFGEFTFTPAALKRCVSMSDDALQYVADRIDLNETIADRPELSVTISTLGADGIKRVADMQLPEVEDVEYVVSWQKADGLAIPSELMRQDVRVVTTETVGLSNNRNNAIIHSRGKLILIADDDLRYTPEQLRTVIATFRNNPSTDLASFRYDKPLRKKYPSQVTPFEQLPKGFAPVSYEIAFRCKLVEGADGLKFNPLLGLGAPYLRAGEEDYFVREAMRAGYRCCYYPEVITTHEGVSTGARPVTDPGVLRANGAMIALCRPLLWPIAILTNSYRIHRLGRAPFILSLKEMLKGALYALRHL